MKTLQKAIQYIESLTQVLMGSDESDDKIQIQMTPTQSGGCPTTSGIDSEDGGSFDSLHGMTSMTSMDEGFPSHDTTFQATTTGFAVSSSGLLSHQPIQSFVNSTTVMPFSTVESTFSNHSDTSSTYYHSGFGCDMSHQMHSACNVPFSSSYRDVREWSKQETSH